MATELFTADLVNANTGFEINESDGITAISIYNGSAVAGSVTGTKNINGVASSAVAIPQNTTVTLQATNANAMGTVTLTIPESCTLSVIAC